MLCLHDRLRYQAPSGLRLLSPVEEARSLTPLVVAAWQGGRILAVHLREAGLAAGRARRPPGPPAPGVAWPGAARAWPRGRG
jgi:hypothetical protein